MAFAIGRSRVESSKVKGKGESFVAYAASAVLCATDKAGVQPRLQPKPMLALTDFGLQPYSRT